MQTKCLNFIRLSLCVYLVSMNKVRVGNAPPPNLREIRSKIGSLENATHKPGLIKLTNRTTKTLNRFCNIFSSSLSIYDSQINCNFNLLSFPSFYRSSGGGKVKIENKKIEFKVTSRIAAKNENYKGPTGGERKVRV